MNVRAVALLSDSTIFAVPLKNDPAELVAIQMLPVPDKVQVPVPIFKVVFVVMVQLNNPVVTLEVTASNVPDVRVSVRVEPSVNASAS